MSEIQFPKQVEQWGVFEICVKGKTDGNPFTDYEIVGEFSSEPETKTVKGFYDGDGIYKIRFMPDAQGSYHFVVKGSFSEETYEGDFEVTAPTGNNHGYLQIRDKYHFVYKDGTPYYSLGTTCYAWVQQKDEMVRETLETLRKSAFNKIRFCIFPKHYDYNYEDPMTFPYEGTPCDNSTLTRETMFAFMEDKSSNHWDFKRFNPAHFARFDKAVQTLMEMGIQADIILFHPYDRWGFDGMGAENDDFYVKYVVARYGAYRNVWWSLANEYDYVKTKEIEDWDRIGELIQREDPFQRFRSVHNGPHYYDFTKSWVTHCSCQGTDRYRAIENTAEMREKYGKPVVWDEVLYEGNIDLGWGNISGPEMTRRFWEATMRGGYVGHGETYLPKNPDEIDNAKLWWAHGGTLKGSSPERIAFLAEIMNSIPGGKGLKPLPQYWDAVAATTEDDSKEFFLFYFSFLNPYYRNIYIDNDTEYQVDVIDTWNMTVKDCGVHKGHFRIIVGDGPYMAIRMTKVKM